MRVRSFFKEQLLESLNCQGRVPIIVFLLTNPHYTVKGCALKRVQGSFFVTVNGNRGCTPFLLLIFFSAGSAEEWPLPRIFSIQREQKGKRMLTAFSFAAFAASTAASTDFVPPTIVHVIADDVRLCPSRLLNAISVTGCCVCDRMTCVCAPPQLCLQYCLNCIIYSLCLSLATTISVSPMEERHTHNAHR